MRLPFLQRLQSLFYPVRLRKGSSTVNPVLELYYYRGRYQLATADALYSDGQHYRPLLAAFRTIGRDFTTIKNVLVLGTGLGSAVLVAHRLGYHPSFTLVDLDSTILDWARELMPKTLVRNITTVCDNAEAFIKADNNRYDLVIVDVFIGREIPAFVTGSEFLTASKARLSANGMLVLNYMALYPDAAQKVKAALQAAFGSVKEISFGLNRVYITR